MKLKFEEEEEFANSESNMVVDMSFDT